MPARHRAAVWNDASPQRRAVLLFQRPQHRRGWRDHHAGGQETGGDRLPILLEPRWGFLPFHCAPPGADAGVRDDDDGRAPLERGMSVAIQVHDIGQQGTLERQQPSSRPPHVVPRILHPLETEGAVEDGEPGSLPFTPLRGTWEGPHHGDGRPHTAGCERAAKVDRVPPHTADGVGRHQHMTNRAASGRFGVQPGIRGGVCGSERTGRPDVADDSREISALHRRASGR